MDGTSGIRNFYKTKPLLSLHYASTNKNKQTLTTPSKHLQHKHVHIVECYI